MDTPATVERAWDTLYECTYCGTWPFDGFEKLKAHYIVSGHLPQCKQCGTLFPAVEDVLSHYLEAHRVSSHATRQRVKRKARKRHAKRDAGGRDCKYINPNGMKPGQITERDLSVVTHLLGEACHSESRLEKHDFTLKSNLESGKKKESKGFLDVKDFTTLPDAKKERMGKRDAVVIDCEMVEGANGDREVAYLSVIDFFSGNIIIDSLIEPRTEVLNWNSRYSGVTEEAMKDAMRTGTSMTWKSMRDVLKTTCDTDTVLIGHALNNDLDVLGLLPSKIVDTSIHTAEAVFFNHDEQKRLPRIWSLKTLAKELLNHDIQTSREGHSALEDAYATREVLFWSLMHPGDLRLWGIEKKRVEDELKAKREAKAEEERQKKRKKEEEAARVAKAKAKVKAKAKAAKESKPGSTGKGRAGDDSDDSWKGDN